MPYCYCGIAMKAIDKKLVSKVMKLDSAEKYTRLFSIKNGNAMSFRSGHVILKENESIGEHNTEDSEEIIIILEGEGELYIKGSETLKFKEGTVAYVPSNTIHDVKNIGNASLKYIFVTTKT